MLPPLPEPKTSLPSPFQRDGLLAWLTTVDHKMLGILYLVMALGYFLMGGLEALAIRIQLAQPEQDLIGPETFNQLFTMHGTTMVFLALMPALIGFATYFLPLMIGANEMAFPRLNAMSFWTTLFGGLLLYFSPFAGGAPDAGWFAYAPLSEKNYSFSPGLDYYCMGLMVTGIGSIGAALNFFVTTMTMRAKGMSWMKMPLFAWMVFINSLLMLGAFPLLNAGLAMLFLDRQLGTLFFLPVQGGSALLWQHFFWAFGHPEVYILILPAFGIISEVVPVFSRKKIYGYPFLVGSALVITFLAFGVWGHHLFTAGMGRIVVSFFGFGSLLIAIPTSIKLVNWLATMWGGSLRFTVSMMFAFAFILDFTIGGLSGVAFAMPPADWALTDTYFVVAHIHYVFLGGTMFSVFAGAYYWYPKICGRMLDVRLGKAHFWLFFIGFQLTFMIQHILGILGMPRRVYTYPMDLPWYGSLNFLSTSGAFLMGLGMLAFLWNLYRSLKHGELAGKDPWGGTTLEWWTDSPPPPKNFETLSEIRSRDPVLDWTESP
jgi:cytochrome c oxidase subunit 1/cytochrome c oxidase subunit I+III